MTAQNITLEHIRHRLESHKPVLQNIEGKHHASVALILEPGDEGTSIFFIERARRKGDPWSGQIAFPGGRREAQDATAQAVAERETMEEVGVELHATHAIGRLSDLQGRHGGTSAGMVISCFVYSLGQMVDCNINHEVQAVARLPLSHLMDKNNLTTVLYREAGNAEFPGIKFGERDPRIVWGLTYRFLRQFFSQLGHSLPE